LATRTGAGQDPSTKPVGRQPGRTRRDTVAGDRGGQEGRRQQRRV